MKVIEKLEREADNRAKELTDMMQEEREKDKKRKCQECGASPAQVHIYNGMYKPGYFPTGKEFIFCTSCANKFDKWYFPPTEYL